MKIYTVGIDFYLVKAGLVYIDLFGKLCISTCFSSEESLLKYGAKEVTSPFLLAKFEYKLEQLT